ncbi:MAG: NAD(P)H-dependent oxidoreductase [Kofleriaceae bacterium]|nr:NAD(P)H-dependent oxidoreductase [Kofleriaceae bacterium]
MNILKIDASANKSGSTGRALSQRLVERLTNNSQATVIQRDADDTLPLLSTELLAALSTEEDERSARQQALSALPETLTRELEAADVLVMSCPIYNFGIPAALKAWIDLVTRARRTFSYTDKGPIGLLSDCPVYLIVTSGGTPIDSDIDFATPYLRHSLGFIGLKDVRVFDASQLMNDGERRLAAVKEVIDAVREITASN